MNKTAIQLIFLLFLLSGMSCTRYESIGKNDKDAGFRLKADSLLKLMTLDEKIGQLALYTSGWDVTGPVLSQDYRNLIKQGKVGGVFNAYTVGYARELQELAVEETRLGIPLIFGYDVIHGHRTIFPVPLGQAASWDTAAIEKSERIAATEATAEGINWVYAPMVDIARDPRWGRVMEGAGEDTWLGCQIARARVKGFQGNDLSSPNTAMACVKHFAAYGAPQAGRDYNTVDMSKRSLFEWYLPPYKAAIDAGAGSLMTSFNEIAGVPSTSNKWLLTDLLRDQWGFTGFVVSDYTAINELINHGVAKDSAQAGELAINAGVDMDMQGGIYANDLKELIKSGKVKESTINKAAENILVAKYKLGLFDDPYRYCNPAREKTDIMRPEYKTFAKEFVAKSCVLLKNWNKTLPISKNVSSIAVIGPLGNSKKDMLGSWSAAGQADSCVTLLDGIKNKLGPRAKISYFKGCDVDSSKHTDIAGAVKLAKKSAYIVLALGESADMTGEAASRAFIDLPGDQLELAKAVITLGKPTAVVLFNGRPLAIPELDKIAPAILETWFGGTEAGNGIADVLFGDYNPSGKITMTFPRSVGQIPIFYNSKNTGRPVDPKHPGEKYKSRYLDSPNTPLYPFGYGLSYTTFSYSDIKLNKTTFAADDTIKASVNVTNTGDYDGEEVVQLYIRDLVGNVTRPVKELKGFYKVMIKSKETKTIHFSLTPDDLRYYHQDMSFQWDPGEFTLFIGTDSATKNSVNFSLE